MIFAPAVTRADVAAIYPGAKIEPASVAIRRTANAAEADELRRLVAVVFADPAARTEALVAALADPESALVCYRALVVAAR